MRELFTSFGAPELDELVPGMLDSEHFRDLPYGT